MKIANPLLPVSVFPVHWNKNQSQLPTRVTFNSTKLIQKNRNVGGYTFSHWGDQPDTMKVDGAIILYPEEQTYGLLSLLVLKQLYRLDKKKVNSILSVLGKYLPKTAIKSTSAAIAGTMVALSAGQEIIARKEQLANPNSDVYLASVISTYSIAEMLARINRMSLKDLSTTYIFYDNFIYSGFFENFTYTRDASKPLFINYSFNFTIEWSTEDTLTSRLLGLSKNRILRSTSLIKI